MLRFWTFKLLTTLISREKLPKKFVWKLKNSWKCWVFALFSSWQLWFPREKIVKFCQNWIFWTKNWLRIVWIMTSDGSDFWCNSDWKCLYVSLVHCSIFITTSVAVSFTHQKNWHLPKCQHCYQYATVQKWRNYNKTSIFRNYFLKLFLETGNCTLQLVAVADLPNVGLISCQARYKSNWIGIFFLYSV